jgi:hypothetical protein
LLAVRERSWQRSLDQLAHGYARALAGAGTGVEAGITTTATGEAAHAGEIARAA